MTTIIHFCCCMKGGGDGRIGIDVGRVVIRVVGCGIFPSLTKMISASNELRALAPCSAYLAASSFRRNSTLLTSSIRG